MLSNLNHYIQRVKSTHDDDSIDRLNYKVTTIYMLLGFALTLFAKNYVGEPMQCWVPNQWTAVWEVFSESYCFVENTYFVPMNQSNLPAAHTREGREMIYYQWVPFILSLMAFLFYIPRGVWNIFSSYSGLALADLMTAARKSAKTGADDPYIPTMANTLRKVHTSKVVRYGSGLFNLYIVMKVNMFNEKIFIFLWFWFAMLLFCTSINLCTWIRRRYSKTARKTFLYNVLTDCGLDTTEAERDEFYREVVQDDGLLVLLLLDANGGRLQSGELAHQLWISKFPQTDDKTISTVAEDEALHLNDQLWSENYPRKRTLIKGAEKMENIEGILKLAYRLKYVYTPWILCGTAFLIFAHEYVGAPIQCWAPKQWAWVPFVLLLQAFLLYLPRLVWKQLQFLTKIDLPSVTVALRNEAKRISDPLNVASIMRPARRGAWGYKLTLSLLFTKMLCDVCRPSLFLMVLMARFLQPNGWSTSTQHVLNGRQWEESGNFPRVTFCDLEVRELGGAVHRCPSRRASWSTPKIAQINMFNEKIFVFLWWWFCVLLFISILNLFRCLSPLVKINTQQDRSSSHCILESAINDDFDAREVSEFCRKTLKTDGVTIVRLIEENATIYQVQSLQLGCIALTERGRISGKSRNLFRCIYTATN
ncbi:Innexin [Ostertagia ostertagi]